MKKLTAVTALSCMIIVACAGLLAAGALDRQNVQPRTNSVTQSMVRVPGVVGMEQFTAMGSLQQAGLGVSVLPSKKTPKNMKGAEGMEGRVISQTPAAGGLAMYGTTVTIYVNKPKPADPNASSLGAGSSSWGTGASSPTYSNPSNQGQAVQGQQYAPQQGGAGMPSQGSSPFQVQQYYYPGAAPQDQQPPAQQPADPGAVPQGAPAQDPSQGMPPQDPSQQPVQQGQPAAPPAQ